MISPTTLEGTVSRIVYEKERFRIVKILTSDGSTVSLKGSFFPVAVSSRIRATGTLTIDPKYGKQFAASAVEELTPDTLEGLEKYLAQLRVSDT
jgi:exodeoxyribonuclease V alpha subunit